MNKLNIEDYLEYIDKNNWNSIRDDILDNTLNIAYKLLEIKNINIIEYEDEWDYRFIKLDKDSSKDKIYRKIEDLFDYVIYTCSDISYLIRWLTRNYKEEDIDSTRIKSFIKTYNNILDEYNDYLGYKEYIEENGYDNIYKDYYNKCIKLFKEMLDYKNKSYDNDDNFNKLYDKVELYYAYYINYLYDLKLALVNSARNRINYEEANKTLDNVESYILIDYNYKYLLKNYKENAFIYRDFDLKEGETISDLYIKQINNFNKLYKEMLEFINIPYDNDATPHSIECLTLEHYPYYKELIEESKKTNYYFDPDIAKLSRMEDVYDKIKATYKNYEEDIKKYVPPKKKEINTEIEDLDIIEGIDDLDE